MKVDLTDLEVVAISNALLHATTRYLDLADQLNKEMPAVAQGYRDQADHANLLHEKFEALIY